MVKRVQLQGHSTSSGKTYARYRRSHDTVRDIDARRMYRMRGSDNGFLQLLISCRNLAATDPRDKVFALLGLGHL